MTGIIDDPAVREFVLAFADDEHLMGQQHTEWIGVAPFLEEDMAFASIGQDELGHAAGLYELALDHAGMAPDDAEELSDAVDDVALRRDAADYRSCWLVEHPGSDWADALVRHVMYDLAEQLRWEACLGSSDDRLAQLAHRALREETFHRRHADALLHALLPDGDAGPRLQAAASRLAPLGDALFEPVTGEAKAVDAGLVTTSTAGLRAAWRAEITSRFGALSFDPAPAQQARTERSPAFDALYASMREVVLLDPAARW